ncbi:unannotated protein [freshwater metagenome]|uniref:Unannotated protein n=1 Tax=freshwater metagenome TaxID=449393 RepID=A0A6J7IBH4_9ZZZZ
MVAGATVPVPGCSVVVDASAGTVVSVPTGDPAEPSVVVAAAAG